MPSKHKSLLPPKKKKKRIKNYDSAWLLTLTQAFLRERERAPMPWYFFVVVVLIWFFETGLHMWPRLA
jgi:hypothetical protein